MLRVNFFKKGFWLVSEPHFVHDFSRKYVSCFILLTDQISLSDFLYFLRYLAIMGIVIAYYPVCDVINFGIYLGFLIKPFSYMTENSEQKLNEKSI